MLKIQACHSAWMKVDNFKTGQALHDAEHQENGLKSMINEVIAHCYNPALSPAPVKENLPVIEVDLTKPKVGWSTHNLAYSGATSLANHENLKAGAGVRIVFKTLFDSAPKKASVYGEIVDIEAKESYFTAESAFKKGFVYLISIRYITIPNGLLATDLFKIRAY
ncbi:hypothetical protein ACI2KR_06555 [Pseudomonas luteola]